MKNTRKSRKMHKLLAMVSCALLLVAISVGATVAYLTSQDSVTNTFTVGHVKITLDEAKVDATGKEVTPEERVQANTYKIFPGGTYDKDPTIHVDAASEEAYLRVKVVFEGGAAADALGLPMLEIFQTIDTANWEIGAKEVGATDVTYVLTYKSTIKGGTSDIVLFEKVEIPDTLTNDDIALLNNVKMNITAYAVQADGFSTADAAFTAANLGV